MITKPLPRHHDLAALIFYLFKQGQEPGEAEQHEADHDHKECLHVDPHLVAAWDPSLLDGQLLDGTPARPDEAGQRALVDLMDSPRLLFGVNLKAGHVYHVPIAAHPDDGVLGDQRWAELAEQAVAAIGVQNCRWVAVWHGPNAAGADHIHLAVQLVGEDGKTARLSYDERKLRTWANQVEERLDLVRTARAGSGARGLTRAEHERAKATGVEPERRQLARLVRAAAAGASNEMDFLAALKAKDVDVRPRVEQGLVVGYSVARPPAGTGGKTPSTDSTPALRLAGGQLARDLTLPRLREHWPPPENRVAEAALLAHWERPGELPEPRRAVRWNTVQIELNKAKAAAAALDPDDQERWNTAVTETAELVCVLAVRLERDQPGPLHRAADALLDAARLGRPQDHRAAWKDSFHRQVVLPMLAKAARIAAYSADPAPVLALAVLAIVAVLVYDLATRQRHDQQPGQSGPALHRAAGELAEHRPAPANPAAAGPLAADPATVDDSAARDAAAKVHVSATGAPKTTRRSLIEPMGRRPGTHSSGDQPQAGSRTKAR
ncbi:relaxase/mobilization nuclease domain-containing protein [Kutzneria buriramensis]|uniref:MobA/VirD2-like nuclease domain-containing protein n=1 Tax=Kutzneria buriramensis TaxID=1045776 RepID=A0A3E0G5Q6_9PSEU|nr:hypothetical protein [Kutzneria buriramensis]REH18023.1 hypothetical protein BCF44_13810 [Kutzneria buriramensis]